MMDPQTPAGPAARPQQPARPTPGQAIQMKLRQLGQQYAALGQQVPQRPPPRGSDGPGEAWTPEGLAEEFRWCASAKGLTKEERKLAACSFHLAQFLDVVVQRQQILHQALGLLSQQRTVDAATLQHWQAELVQTIEPLFAQAPGAPAAPGAAPAAAPSPGGDGGTVARMQAEADAFAGARPAAVQGGEPDEDMDLEAGAQVVVQQPAQRQPRRVRPAAPGAQS